MTGPKRGARATGLETQAPIRWSEDVRWLERAAERGRVPAQKDLAWRYLRGIGVKPDWERARDLWERATGQVPSSYVGLHRWAAKRGDPAAMHELGCFALEGVGMRKDLHRAVAWLRKAAELGNLEAPSYLDFLADEGVVEARSIVPFLRRAAEAGDADAQLALGVRLENGEGVRRNIQESVRWYRRAAEQGDELGWLLLGHAHRKGLGARQSWPRALDCYRRAAAKGDGDAFAWLFEYHDGHQGVPRNARAAATWLRRAEAAAKRGEVDVCRFLDDVYGYGFADDPRKGIDPRRAVRWVRLGAAANDPACLMRLGIHLFDGTGVRQDRRRGLALYRRAAELGNERAAYLLGRCYAEGDGVRRDRRRARRWLERAAKGGELGAHRVLARLRRS